MPVIARKRRARPLSSAILATRSPSPRSPPTFNLIPEDKIEATFQSQLANLGVPDELARLLAEENEEGAEEGARKVKEDWGDVDEEA